jgi:hypothetical protein
MEPYIIGYRSAYFRLQSVYSLTVNPEGSLTSGSILVWTVFFCARFVVLFDNAVKDVEKFVGGRFSNF